MSELLLDAAGRRRSCPAPGCGVAVKIKRRRRDSREATAGDTTDPAPLLCGDAVPGERRRRGRQGKLLYLRPAA